MAHRSIHGHSDSARATKARILLTDRSASETKMGVVERSSPSEVLTGFDVLGMEVDDESAYSQRIPSP